MLIATLILGVLVAAATIGYSAGLCEQARKFRGTVTSGAAERGADVDRHSDGRARLKVV